jgi:hypothetical protein
MSMCSTFLTGVEIVFSTPSKVFLESIWPLILSVSGVRLLEL